jgi:hypothetical protein
MAANVLHKTAIFDSAPDVEAQFYSSLEQQANQAIAPIYHTTIEPIQYPSQGDFNWYWENSNLNFNNGTFKYISAGVSPGTTPGTVQLSPAGGFPNSYVRLLSSLAFTLDANDQATLNQALQNAQAQEIAVVSTYTGIFGEITADQMAQAQKVIPAVQTNFDYVVSYVLGAVWSGATPPLTWATMKAARNLQQLLPNMPASGEPVLGTVQIFLNVLGTAISLQDELNLGTWILGQLNSNTSAPSESNGGMPTVDPNNGKILPFQVAYTISSPVTSIQNDLNNTNRSFQLSMATSQAAQQQLDVSIAESSEFAVGGVLYFSDSQGNQYNMNTFAGTSASSTITVTFTGFTMVPSAPSAWQQATDLGWFYGDPIAEAWQHWTSGTNPTGFNFVSDPSSILGKDGRGLGQISNLLISNYPTISITYTDADYQTFQSSWVSTASGNITLFGFIPIGSFSAGVYSSSSQQNGSNSSFTLSFTPSKQVLSVPTLQQTAYVIGGSFDYPATDQTSIVQKHLRLMK